MFENDLPAELYKILNDALKPMYNNTNLSSNNEDLTMLKLIKNNKVSYVAVIKCPGLNIGDISMDFDYTDEGFPVLRVKGSTSTILGTFSIDVGAVVSLPDNLILSKGGPVLKNGILYIYFDSNKNMAIPTTVNEDFM